MHIVVYGLGAIGGFYGSLLLKAAKTKVSFLARGQTFKIVSEQGLQLKHNIAKDDSANELFETLKQKVDVYDNYSDIESPDIVLLCVKSKDTSAAAKDIKKNLGKETYVVSVQNGVENEEILAEELGKERVMPCLTNIASQVEEPGKILKTGDYSIVLGEFDGQITKRLALLEKTFKEADINVVLSKQIYQDQWRKLVWNTGFNPISALHELEAGPLLENPVYRKTMRGIMDETVAVAHAQGIMIPDDTTEKWLKRTDVPEWYHFKTSMLQDILRARPIELEELLGIVIRKARELGLKTPYAESVYEPLKAKIEQMGLAQV